MLDLSEQRAETAYKHMQSVTVLLPWSVFCFKYLKGTFMVPLKYFYAGCRPQAAGRRLQVETTSASHPPVRGPQAACCRPQRSVVVF